MDSSVSPLVLTPADVLMTSLNAHKFLKLSLAIVSDYIQLAKLILYFKILVQII